MASIAEIMQLCRLCLVKEQVNVPIFEEQDDVRQIFVKITACLPVKVSKEDNLPKKICDGCLYKLELLYQFSNTTTNAEKQLLSWLSDAGLDTNKNTTNKSGDHLPAVSKTRTNSKTEPNNTSRDSLSIETKSYILQQQQLPYESDEFPFQEDDFEEQSTADAPAVSNSEDVEQPPSKRRRTAAPTLLQEPPDESDEDADYPPIEDSAKTDEGSEDDAMVESSLIEVLNEEEQPGPSGIGKAEAQSPAKDIYKRYERLYGLKKCVVLLGSLKKLDTKKYTLVKSRAFVDLDVDNVIDSPRTRYKCEICGMRFKLYSLFNSHRALHKYSESESTDFYCDDTSASSSSSDEDTFEESKTYVCKFCSAAFKNSHAYAAHHKKHKYEKSVPDQEELQCEETMKTKSKCIFCPHVADSEMDLSTHFINVHDTNTSGFSCEICLIDFHKFNNLLQHNSLKHSLICNVCNIKFKSFLTLTTHRLMLHSPANPSTTYSCTKCSVKFDDMCKLKLHMKAHAKSEEKNARNMKYEKDIVKCDFCSKEFEDSEELQNHLSTHFSIVKIINNEKSENSQKPEQDVQEKGAVKAPATNCIQENQIVPRLKCTLCSKKYHTRKELNAHIKQHFAKQTASNKPLQIKTVKNIAPLIKPAPQTSEALKAPLSIPVSSASALAFPVHTAIPVQKTMEGSLPVSTTNEPLSINQNQAKVLFLDNNRYIILPQGVTPISNGGVIKIHQAQSVEGLYPNNPNYNIVPQPMNNILQQLVSQTIALPNNHINSQINITPQTNNISQINTNPPISVNIINPTEQAIPKKTTVDLNEPLQKWVISKKQPKKVNILKHSSSYVMSLPNKIAQNFKKDHNSINTSADKSVLIPTTSNINPKLLQENNQLSSTIKEERTVSPPKKSCPTEQVILNGASNVNSVDRSSIIVYANADNDKQKEVNSSLNESFESNIDKNPTTSGELSDKNDISTENFKPKIFLKPLSELLQKSFETKHQETTSASTSKSNPSEEFVVLSSTSKSKTEEIVLLPSTSKAGTELQEHSYTAYKPLNQLLGESVENKQEATASTSEAEEYLVLSKATKSDSDEMFAVPSTSKADTQLKEDSGKTNKSHTYKCNMCNVFSKKSPLRLRRHQSKFKCKVCEFTSCKVKLMDQHYEKIHEYKNRCASCDKQFPTPADLQNHKKEVHFCIKCKKCFLDLNKHKQTIKCLHCPFKACNAYNLDIHYKVVHAITTRCTPCNTVFYSPESFVKHKEEIHYCSKCKTYKMDLNIHQSFCKGESPDNKTDEIEHIIELDSD